MDINDLRSLFTVLMVFLFTGIVWWAYSDRRKAEFDAAARLPLDDDLPLAVDGGRNAQASPVQPENRIRKGNHHE